MAKLKEKITLYCKSCGCNVKAVKGKLVKCCGNRPMKEKRNK